MTYASGFPLFCMFLLSYAGQEIGNPTQIENRGKPISPKGEMLVGRSGVYDMIERRSENEKGVPGRSRDEELPDLKQMIIWSRVSTIVKKVCGEHMKSLRSVICSVMCRCISKCISTTSPQGI
jgi:hypothetical protein